MIFVAGMQVPCFGVSIAPPFPIPQEDTYIHTYIHIYVYRYILITYHPYIYMQIDRAVMHVYIHIYIHTYVHPSIHPSIHPYLSTYLSIFTCIYIYVSMNACMHECMQACSQLYMNACMYVFMYVRLWEGPGPLRLSELRVKRGGFEESLLHRRSSFLHGSWRKLGVPYLGVLVIRIPTIQGAILGSPIFGSSYILAPKIEEQRQLLLAATWARNASLHPQSIRRIGSGFWCRVRVSG